MTTITAEPAARFEIGRILERMAGVLRRNFASLALIALLLSALPHALGALLVLASHHDVGEVVAPVIQRWGPAFWVMGVLGVVSAILLQPALLFGVAKDLTGARASLGEMLAVAVRTALPVLAVGIVAWLAVCVAAIFLIVPGIIVALILCVALPARVLEGPGVMRALNRSADLTRGHRWGILGFFLILMLIFIVISMIAGVVTSALHLVAGEDFMGSMMSGARYSWWNWPSLLIVRPLVSALETLIGATAAAALYYELRQVKEGVDAGSLLANFD